MTDGPGVYLAKAQESLASAQSEFANGRFNTCANRCYYACFQAAIAALLAAGIRSTRTTERWKHEYVQSEFVRILINSKKLYEPSLRDTLARLQTLRQVADYEPDSVTRTEASRALRRAGQFVEAVTSQLGDTL